MPFRVEITTPKLLGIYLLKWLSLTLPVGMLVGTACALFLWLLEVATTTRLQRPDLVYLLPLAGLVVGAAYALFGKSVEAGNNLIVDEIHEPGGGIPLRMAPLILLGTVVTHLCGGSAGREGTAVQMGGSLAGGLAKWIPGLRRHDIRILLMAGVSAGFGGVFGTPVAGAVFALEVLIIGRMNSEAILPCLIAGVISDQVCTAWGIGHTHYHVASSLPAGSELHLAPVSLRLMSLVVLASILFGLASALFTELVHSLSQYFKRWIKQPMIRPVVGGTLVLALMFAAGTRDYLGLGVSSPDPQAVTIVSCFRSGGADSWSWLWKIVFTAVTIGSGFKGGEVTPLFFIGAALGNTLAIIFQAPVDLFAALGFVAVFAGATNTPLACTFMAVELFGGEYVLYYFTACVVAWLCSGHTGIYLSQRIGVSRPGSGHDHAPAEVLQTLREARASHGRQTPKTSAPPTAGETKTSDA